MQSAILTVGFLLGSLINENLKGSDCVITAQAPGKLYVAGEYAVVETGFPAIIVALDQFVTVTVEATKHFGSVVSEQYQENFH